jgi:hypothetical protein
VAAALDDLGEGAADEQSLGLMARSFGVTLAVPGRNPDFSHPLKTRAGTIRNYT